MQDKLVALRVTLLSNACAPLGMHSMKTHIHVLAFIADRPHGKKNSAVPP